MNSSPNRFPLTAKASLLAAGLLAGFGLACQIEGLVQVGLVRILAGEHGKIGTWDGEALRTWVNWHLLIRGSVFVPFGVGAVLLVTKARFSQSVRRSALTIVFAGLGNLFALGTLAKVEASNWVWLSGYSGNRALFAFGGAVGGILWLNFISRRSASTAQPISDFRITA